MAVVERSTAFEAVEPEAGRATELERGMIEDRQQRKASTKADQCCDPHCGPETCGP